MENCHNDIKTNPKRRGSSTEEHTDIALHHAEDIRWCLDCHDADNRDVLHLQNGDKIEFTESYRLCGQCHGDKYRDWKKGIHGKRTGMLGRRKAVPVVRTLPQPPRAQIQAHQTRTSARRCPADRRPEASPAAYVEDHRGIDPMSKDPKIPAKHGV